MEKDELKRKFHQLIDEIEDKNKLSLLYEDAVEYNTSYVAEKDLTDEQLILINKAREEVKKGSFLTHEEVMANLKKCSDTA